MMSGNDELDRGLKSIIAMVVLGAFLLVLVPTMLVGCETADERQERQAREFSEGMARSCLRMKGNPNMEGSEFKGCDFTRRFSLKRE